jgi:type II secretory pathway pseudopilin PulG
MTDPTTRCLQMVRQTKFRQKGFGYIEVLVSTLILAVSLLAALSLYGFSMGMIDKTADEGFAYNLGRQALENVRQLGFDPVDAGGNHTLLDGTTTTYYDSKGGNAAAATFPTARFRLVQKILSDRLVTGTAKPAPDAMRTVTITIYYVKTGEQIEQCGTILARSGV